MANDRMTNSKALEMAIATLTEQGFDAEALTKLANIKTSIDKKSSYKSTKPTKAQVANEGVKATILEILTNATEPMTVTDITKAFDTDEITVPKVSALLRQLKNDNKVARTEIKGRPFYSIA